MYNTPHMTGDAQRGAARTFGGIDVDCECAAVSMPDWFVSLHPIWQALLAGLFTWGVTALGASVVFLGQDISRRTLDTPWVSRRA